MKKLLITLSIIFVIAAGIFGFLNSKSKNTENYSYDLKTTVQEITKETKLIDPNTDHNQALDVMEYAKQHNIEIPEIIINFDTHSDIYLNDPGILPDSGVEDWLNEFIAKNPKTDTLYWVMPDEEAKNIIIQILLGLKNYDIPREFSPLIGNSQRDMNPLYFVFNPLTQKSYTQYFLQDTRNKAMNEYTKDNKSDRKLFRKYVKYKKVKIITCTKETLPDFKGKKVFLSIDADYTSNSGFDTSNNFKFIKSDEDIKKTFYEIFKTVEEKDITPIIISMSLSPQYLPKSKHEYVKSLFDDIIKYSNHLDLINTYKHFYDPARYEHIPVKN